MKHLTRKQIIDLIPLVILIITAAFSWIHMFTHHIVIKWQHYLGLVFLVLIILVLTKNHQAGVLLTGATTLIAAFGIISFDIGISKTYLSFGNSESSLLFYFGNPVMFLWFILHTILSFRIYIGILS